MLVVPAVLPTSRKDLKEKLALLTKIPQVTRIQIDVVDGKFATPASWPYNAPGELESMVAYNETLPHLDRITYEIDLMCLDAERATGLWLALGASRLTFHAESTTDLPQFLRTVRQRYGAGDIIPGLISFGLATNLASDTALIESCLDEITYVQFMGIAKIGRQGEPFDPRVLTRVRNFHREHPDIEIQVDGGISLQHESELLSLGVTNMVIGSHIIAARDPGSAFASFEKAKAR